MASITTIIRAHSIGCAPFLERALLSIVGQSVPTHVIIVCQGFTPDDLGKVEVVAEKHRFGALASATIVNVPNPEKADLRSKLLNVGIASTTTRFLHFLDFDDLMYPEAYGTLTATLSRTTAAAAFGGITSTYYETIGGRPFVLRKVREFFGKSKYDVFLDNFCPIHSYVLDLEKIVRDDLYFDESLTALEDYHFLIRILAKYEADFSNIDHQLGEYYRRTGDTVAAADLFYPDARIRISKLQRAREAIQHLKRTTTVTVPLSEFDWMLTGGTPQAAPPNQRVRFLRDGSLQAGPLAPAVTRLIQRQLYGIVSQLPFLDAKKGLLDTAKMSQDDVSIGGWLRDSILDEPDTTLCLVGPDGLLLHTPRRHDRGDVRSHFQISDQGLGFEFRLPAASGRPENFHVFVLDNEGHPMAQLARHG